MNSFINSLRWLILPMVGVMLSYSPMANSACFPHKKERKNNGSNACNCTLCPLGPTGAPGTPGTPGATGDTGPVGPTGPATGGGLDPTVFDYYYNVTPPVNLQLGLLGFTAIPFTGGIGAPQARGASIVQIGDPTTFYLQPGTYLVNFVSPTVSLAVLGSLVFQVNGLDVTPSALLNLGVNPNMQAIIRISVPNSTFQVGFSGLSVGLGLNTSSITFLKLPD